jgi:prepilin-type N-terminal cleavage/methylation domain-containing protein
MKLSNKSAGFTLTELLIVLLIIGILVAIAIPNYMSFVKKVKDLWGW